MIKTAKKNKLLLKLFIGSIMLGVIFVPTIFVLTSCSAASSKETYNLSLTDGIESSDNNILIMKDINKDKITTDGGNKYNAISLDFRKFSNYNGYAVRLPSNIDKFTNITTLSIIGMPNAGFSLDKNSVNYIAKMTYLKKLVITGFSLNDLNFMEKLKKIEYVDFSSDALSSIDSLIEFGLPKLEHIDVHYNDINRMKTKLDMSGIPNLNYLNLNTNKTNNLPNEIIKWSSGTLSLGIDLGLLPKDESDMIIRNGQIKLFT